ncbi:MAG TPA: hypothetical protein VG603_09985 [Chitinophagales bacterium]|nr:hypothetical protein [Chitinophagales bacterium]
MKRYSYLPSLIISVIVLVVGVSMLERHFKNELLKAGLLSNNSNNLYPYGRRVSGYTVTENVPNFKFGGFDENLNPSPFETDNNGFLAEENVKREKEKGITRIFIVGGSTAWGSLESRSVMKDSSYPVGSYCYNATIAGKLKKLLTQKYPEQKFEVIDAAVVGFKLSQDFALYMERLHDFDPDIVINIDGYNDMGNMTGKEGLNDPYSDNEQQLEEGLELSAIARIPKWPYTLAYYNYKQIRQQAKLEKHKMFSRKRVSDNKTPITLEPDISAYNLKKHFNPVSTKLLWLVASYEKQLNADGVYSVFCLQPTLQRRENQKQLSPLELKFRNKLETVTVVDTVNIKANIEQLIPGIINNSGLTFDSLRKEMGLSIYGIKNLNGAFLLNDMSPVFDSLITANGGAYVDVNKKMNDMGSDKEFYTDYCHLTPYGNQFVAELLLKKVELYLHNKKGVVAASN